VSDVRPSNTELESFFEKKQLEIKQNFVLSMQSGHAELESNVVREITNEETSLILIGLELYEKTLFEMITTEGP
jgi:hypothetical protein